jgi:hypothetical protein
LAGHDREVSFAANGSADSARARGNQIRHCSLILQQARLGKSTRA